MLQYKEITSELLTLSSLTLRETFSSKMDVKVVKVDIMQNADS